MSNSSENGLSLPNKWAILFISTRRMYILFSLPFSFGAKRLHLAIVFLFLSVWPNVWCKGWPHRLLCLSVKIVSPKNSYLAESAERSSEQSVSFFCPFDQMFEARVTWPHRLIRPSVKIVSSMHLVLHFTLLEDLMLYMTSYGPSKYVSNRHRKHRISLIPIFLSIGRSKSQDSDGQHERPPRHDRREMFKKRSLSTQEEGQRSGSRQDHPGRNHKIDWLVVN